MKQADISKLFGYSMSVIMTGVGIITLFGFVISENVPKQFRIMFGVVFILWGIYRFVITRTRASQAGRLDE